MITEDAVGRGLRQKTLTVQEAVDMFQAGQVVVYAEVPLTEGEETWQDVEHAGSGSTLMADLTNAGATEDQMFDIGANIERARTAGRTLSATIPPPGTTTG